ncbi:uncharacterized protein LOC134669114 [Cydia fagiglandana]|uniref:uncharacterized protein LOC134669114 n=1 Tax=Cydia fagiglandana TaxID=1458189 RepID=UPI002FEE11D0
MLTGQGRVEPPGKIGSFSPAMRLQLPMSRMSPNSTHLYLLGSPGVNATSPKVRAPWRVGSSRGELSRKQNMDEHRSQNPEPERKRGEKRVVSAEATTLNMDAGEGENAKRILTETELLSRQKNRAKRLATLFAVMTNPFTALTVEQAEHIKNALESCILKLAERVQTEDTYWPSFSGPPGYSEGVLKLRCEGMKDVEWVQNALATINSPIPGTKLVIKRQRDIPRRLKSAVLIPSCTDDTETIHNFLISQNEWYKISKWALYKVERTEEPPGTFLDIGIPFDEIATVMARERRLLYKESVGYIRFYGKGATLKDMPPPALYTPVVSDATT